MKAMLRSSRWECARHLRETCLAAGARGAETERSLASFQVGHAHAGEQHAGKLLRRKSYRARE